MVELRIARFIGSRSTVPECNAWGKIDDPIESKEQRVWRRQGGVCATQGLGGRDPEHRLARSLLSPRKLSVLCADAIPNDDPIGDLATGDTSNMG